MNSLIFSSIILFAGITSKEIKEFDRTLAEKEHSLVQLAKAVKEPSVLEAVSSFRKNCAVMFAYAKITEEKMAYSALGSCIAGYQIFINVSTRLLMESIAANDILKNNSICKKNP